MMFIYAIPQCISVVQTIIDKTNPLPTAKLNESATRGHWTRYALYGHIICPLPPPRLVSMGPVVRKWGAPGSSLATGQAWDEKSRAKLSCLYELLSFSSLILILNETKVQPGNKHLWHDWWKSTMLPSMSVYFVWLVFMCCNCKCQYF